MQPDQRATVPHVSINDMELVQSELAPVHLFFDIFVHPSIPKIVAVVPYYGDEWEIDEVDLDEIHLSVEGHRVRGNYLSHVVDGWEPSALLDFEDPSLAQLLQNRDEISFTIDAGPHRKDFTLTTGATPPWGTVMSLVLKDENRWLAMFLEYYLSCLGVDHVLVYDNATADQTALEQILRPYIDAGQVTQIPWDYRWRAYLTEKHHMIAQPAQEAHSLNRFAHCRWIGFFDVDEFLQLRGKTLPEFLAQYEDDAADGLSFGMRWTHYVGPKSLDEVADPPLTFRHTRRDELGRSRQKLIVSPRDVRFLRLHWIEDGKRELAVDDTDIFFHHYVQRPGRFEEEKTKPSVYDDGMLEFADQLGGLCPPATPSGSTDQRPPRPADAEQWIARILTAFDAAETGPTDLPASVMSVEGFCGVFTRRFLNALCSFDGCRYLEVGSLNGASLTAAVSGNRVSAVAIDNWSSFGGSSSAVMTNLRGRLGESSVDLISKDCFAVDPNGLGPFDVYFYDGDHEEASQRRAIEHFVGTLDRTAVFVVDDWNWTQVREGTRAGFDGLDVRVLFEKEIQLRPADVADMPQHRGRETWWNGLGVFLLSVTKPRSESDNLGRLREIQEQVGGAGNSEMYERLLALESKMKQATAEPKPRA